MVHDVTERPGLFGNGFCAHLFGGRDAIFLKFTIRVVATYAQVSLTVATSEYHAFNFSRRAVSDDVYPCICR